jgi:antitoxin VapB
MSRSPVCVTNQNQAVNLPKAATFLEAPQVEIIKLGHSRYIARADRRWDEFFVTGPRASEDFMTERNQPAAQDPRPAERELGLDSTKP